MYKNEITNTCENADNKPHDIIMLKYGAQNSLKWLQMIIFLTWHSFCNFLIRKKFKLVSSLVLALFIAIAGFSF